MTTTVMGDLWQEVRRHLAWPADPRPADRSRIIAAAMAFPLDEIVAGYRRQANVSEEDALDRERELRRYLAIAAMYPASRVPIAGPVDELWRVFLDKREYADFCRQVAGRFIHHEPAPARRRDARRFASLYRRTFGHAPSIVWWPQMALLLPGNPDRAKDGSGGCPAIDVMLILRKGREPVTDCLVELSAERAPTEPKVFTRIHVHYKVSGRGLAPAKVERAIALSAEKYCSASIMLGEVAEITHDFEVIDETVAA